MITIVVNNEKLISTKGHNGWQYIEVYGLSTDQKPTDVPNATPFYEMDTMDVYLYDAENQTWLPQQ